MKFIHLNEDNCNDYENVIQNGKNLVFILIYMDGCGPCNRVKPEWKKIKNIYKDKESYKNIYIMDIERENQNKLSLSDQPISYPTIKFITDNGSIEETYNQDRDVNSLVTWIKSKNSQRGGRKWTLRYKKKINCKQAKGFSQKQYCKSKQKKRTYRKTNKRRKKSTRKN
jgi:hypothetical protein